MKYNRSTNKKDVRKYKVNKSDFARWFTPTDGCWFWLGGKNTSGYGLYSVKNTDEDYERTGRRVTQVLAHRLMASFYNELNPYDYVCHHCDNPTCVNPDHLFIGTAKDNVDDMRRKGRDNYTKRKPHSPPLA